jgi:hypothetical protein
MIRVVNIVDIAEIVRSLQEISENLSRTLKIENSFLWASAESQHRDIHISL